MERFAYDYTAEPIREIAEGFDYFFSNNKPDPETLNVVNRMWRAFEELVYNIYYRDQACGGQASKDRTR